MAPYSNTFFNRAPVLNMTKSLTLVFLAASSEVANQPALVWFDQPGKTFLEATVIGNGRLGAMDLGGVDRQRVILNESSMWSGGPYDGNNYDAYKSLPEVRSKLFAGDVAGAEATLKAAFRYADGIKGYRDSDQFGCYQILADLFLDFSVPPIFSSPTGHEQGDGKTIAGSHDGNPDTKWCVDKAGDLVAWQIELPQPRSVTGYFLTSADDVPERVRTGGIGNILNRVDRLHIKPRG